MDHVEIRPASGLCIEQDGSRGEWIVFVQGLGGHSGFWQQQIAAFKDDNRVVTHDHAGIGKSCAAPARRSVSTMAQDVIDVMDAVGAKRAHVVGHSMGGLIAQELALNWPHRIESLVIGASFARPSNYIRLLLEFRLKILRDLGPAAYCRFQALSGIPPELFEADLNAVLCREKRSLAATSNVDAVAGRILAILDFDRSADLASIRIPTLVLAAKDDTFVPLEESRRLAEGIEGARFEVFESGGHFFPQYLSPAYCSTVKAFLNCAS